MNNTNNMRLNESEEKDGIRFSWNAWPSSCTESTKTIVPIACLYTPLKERDDFLQTPTFYEPVTCKAPCKAILNPYCQIDVQSKLWVCPFCLQRNTFPHQYKDISPQNLPLELLPKYSTIEYNLNKVAQIPPIFLFIVDTCIEEEKDLKTVKESLIDSLDLLPEYAWVGLITFGTMTQVHELKFINCPKSFVFRGTKEYTNKQIQDMLGLANNSTRAAAGPGRSQTTNATNRFLLPVKDCKTILTSILENLQRDPWPVAADKRPIRCTGVAMSIAVGLLETAFPNTGARMMLFSGGACTEGPGKVVSNELREHLRSHQDINKGTVKHYKKAAKFYESLAKRASHNGHTVDIFSCCLDQNGLLEMKSMVNYTSGLMILADAFTTIVFTQGFKNIFAKDANKHLKMGFNATMDVQTTRELKVSGLIGHAISANKESSCVGDTKIGISDTSAWKMSSLNHETTNAVYFEVVNQPDTPFQPGSHGLIQFVTHYQHSSGRFRLRVTTVARNFAEGRSPEIASSFDQETAAVIMARIAVSKIEIEDGPKVVSWVNKKLIQLCQRFASYYKEDPYSFKLTENFNIFPQYMYHLRRSQFLQVFNNSPDETTYYRHVINCANIDSSLIMIQPTLISYDLNSPPKPVLLDSVSVNPNAILLLDTFFHVLLFHGTMIVKWRSENYQDQAGHENFKRFLKAPKDDALEVIKGRFPVPRYVDCDQGSSQARFLLTKLNPSHTHTTDTRHNIPANEVVLTDDISLQTYIEVLKKATVTGSS